MKQKKSIWQTLTGFLNDNSPLMTKIGRIALLAELNLFVLLCSLPLVTAGAAWTALHTVLFDFSTMSYGSALKTYFCAFRRALRPVPLLCWLLTAAALAALGAGWYTVLTAQLTDNFAVMLPLLLSTAVVLFTVGWLYPLAAYSVEEKSASFKTLLSASFLLGLKELPRSFAVLILLLLPAALLPAAASASATAVGLWCLFGISPFALCHNTLVKFAIFKK